MTNNNKRRNVQIVLNIISILGRYTPVSNQQILKESLYLVQLLRFIIFDKFNTSHE